MNFKEQSIKWIQGLAARRRIVKPSTLAMYGSWLRAIPAGFADMDLSRIDNGAVRDLVGKLDYRPGSVQGIIGLVKRVIASAVDENGSELYPRKWNNEFIDLPKITGQKQPVISAQEIECILKSDISEDMRALVVLLAGTGMRLGEALALKPENVQKDGFIRICATMWRRNEQDTKTQAGVREVDIPGLKEYMSSFIAKKPDNEYIFPYWPTTLYRQLNLPGFHSLRRFRVSWLRKQGVQERLIQYWIGHGPESITDRYDKVAQDAVYRQEVAVKAGLGFSLV